VESNRKRDEGQMIPRQLKEILQKSEKNVDYNLISKPPIA